MGPRSCTGPASASSKPRWAVPPRPRPEDSTSHPEEACQRTGTGAEAGQGQGPGCFHSSSPSSQAWSQLAGRALGEGVTRLRPSPGHWWVLTLTVRDVTKTLGVQQVSKPGHLILQLSDQLVVGVFIDDGITTDLLGPVSVPGQPREVWAKVQAYARPWHAQSPAWEPAWVCTRPQPSLAP